MPAVLLASPRQRKYLEQRALGKSQKEAGLIAGYKESTSLQASRSIESPEVKALFAETLRKLVPQGVIAKVFADGLKATKTSFFKDGSIRKVQVDFGERREYAKLLSEYAGYVARPGENVSVTIGISAVAPRAALVDTGEPDIDATIVSTPSTPEDPASFDPCI